MVGHDSSQGLEENAHRMRAALNDIRTGAVAPAARDDNQGRFSAGEAVGFVEEEIVAWGEAAATLQAVFERLADGREILTCVWGDGAPLAPQAIEALAPADVEIECHDGGQPHYWWLVAAE
jgi:uncharacterized protein